MKRGQIVFLMSIINNTVLWVSCRRETAHYQCSLHKCQGCIRPVPNTRTYSEFLVTRLYCKVRLFSILQKRPVL